MPINSEGGFNFDLEPQRTYDPVLIAERVMWPLVDTMWRDDWRKKSHDGNHMFIAKRGARDGELYDSTLAVEKYACVHNADYEPTEDELSVSLAALGVECILTDERRDMVVSLAIEEEEEEARAENEGDDDEEEADEADDEEEMKKVADFDIEELTVKVGSTFRFISSGSYELTSAQLIEDFEGNLLWDKPTFFGMVVEKKPDPENSDEENPSIALVQIISPKILDQDMDLLETGLIVFKSPQFVIEAFQAIRNNPVVAS